MPQPNPIFTIGHSGHTLDEFIALLAKHQIIAIADVRSMPYSRFTPQFNREDLQAALKAAGIRYAFMGAELGARRSEAECYIDGMARHDLIAKAPLFHDGLLRLQQGAHRHRISMMCAEKDPLTCHRAILVCRSLKPAGVAISHILEDGQLESHEKMETRLLKLAGLDNGDLFSNPEQLLERAYDWQAERIAYVQTLTPAEEAAP